MIIPGIEFSTEYYVPTRDEAKEIHVIGIFPDGVNELEFDDILEDIDSGKEAYVAAILDNLEARGICITMDEVYNVERDRKSVV